MHGATHWRPHRLALVLTLTSLVHAGPFSVAAAFAQASHQPAKAKRAPATAKPKPADETLPRAVLDMIDLIRTAVASGRLEDLKDAVDWNEMKPDFGPEIVADPVAYWKSISKDGEGRDILEVLGKLLSDKPAVRPLGRDLENNRLYIWPSFADTPVSQLSPDEVKAFTALVPDDQLGLMQDRNRYTGWRLTLGADGTWHSFRRD